MVPITLYWFNSIHECVIVIVIIARAHIKCRFINLLFGPSRK